jgi:hypothetical protein
MNTDLIAEIWQGLVDHMDDKSKQDAAHNFVNILVDYDIKDKELDALLGIDEYLDQAVEYAIDEDYDEDYIDDEENYNDED